MLHLPYGDTFIPFDETGALVLRSRADELAAGLPGDEIVRAAMARPYGGARLSELAVGKRTCTLIVSDHTRPVPSRDILPAMLSELRAGNPDIRITLLVATGCHRGTTRAELAQKLGEAIVQSERIAVHDAADTASNVQIGILPSGAPLVIDRLAPREGEAVVVKTRPNGFSDTALLAELGDHGGEMIVAGFMTHNCVSSTVRAALDLGILPTVVADATATRDLTYAGGVVTAAALQRAELAGLADRHAVVVDVAELARE